MPHVIEPHGIWHMTPRALENTDMLFPRSPVSPDSEPSVGPVDLSAEAFVDALEAIAISHRAINHPYLAAMAGGDLPDMQGALRDFGHQYLAYSRNFARYLTATMVQLDDVEHRKALVDNLAEEGGHLHDEDIEALEAIGVDPDWVMGVPHPMLFRRFLAAFGMDDAWLAAHDFCPEAKAWSEAMLALCGTGGAARAVGAIGPGTEAVVSTLYRPIVDALRRWTDLERRDRVFFDLHCEVDDEHAAILRNIAVDIALDPTARLDLYAGARQALELREVFFDFMYARALAMEPVA